MADAERDDIYADFDKNRHLAQRPDGDVKDTDWARSLKNWGHDPVR